MSAYVTTQSRHSSETDYIMEIIAELLILGIFYITGYILITILSIGAIKPELVNWKIRKNWDFETMTYIENDKRYLDWEWVIILGLIFWLTVRSIIYYV